MASQQPMLMLIDDNQSATLLSPEDVSLQVHTELTHIVHVMEVLSKILSSFHAKNLCYMPWPKPQSTYDNLRKIKTSSYSTVALYRGTMKVWGFLSQNITPKHAYYLLCLQKSHKPFH